jgi:hypothetical protein
VVRDHQRRGRACSRCPELPAPRYWRRCGPEPLCNIGQRRAGRQPALLP